MSLATPVFTNFMLALATLYPTTYRNSSLESARARLAGPVQRPEVLDRHPSLNLLFLIQTTSLPKTSPPPKTSCTYL